MSTYRVSELARRTGVPATTLRFYEVAGLLPAQRSRAGYRLYGEPAVERLGFIGAAKRLGLSLAEIGELLQVWETGACLDVKTDLRPRLEARLAEAERRRWEVDGFIASVRGALAHLDALPDRYGRCDPNCGFLTLTAYTADPAASPRIEDRPRQRGQEAPVACALPAEDIGGRAERWRAVVAGAVRAPIPDGLRLTVPIERLPGLAELAAAEQACCPFFDFRLHLDGPDLHVEVRTSPEGQPVLAALFDSPGQHGQGRAG